MCEEKWGRKRGKAEGKWGRKEKVCEGKMGERLREKWKSLRGNRETEGKTGEKGEGQGK